MKYPISAAILAGGTATRLAGMRKYNFIVNGRTILSRILETLDGIFGEFIIVTGNHQEFNNLNDCKIVSDIFPGIGPLGGIHAAVKNSGSDAVFIVAGDMPLINRDIVEQQVETYVKTMPDILIPRIGSYIEPLHSIYGKGVLPGLEDYIVNKKDFAVWKFIETAKSEFFYPGDSQEIRSAFMSINTFDDAAKAERIMRGL